MVHKIGGLDLRSVGHIKEIYIQQQLILLGHIYKTSLCLQTRDHSATAPLPKETPTPGTRSSASAASAARSPTRQSTHVDEWKRQQRFRLEAAAGLEPRPRGRHAAAAHVGGQSGERSCSISSCRSQPARAATATRGATAAHSVRSRQ